MSTKRIVLRSAPLALMAALAGCGTPAQQAAETQVAVTLAAVAVKSNSTAANLVSKGALLCGEAVSPSGVLLTGAVTAIANAIGVPVSVTGALPADVAQACAAIGLVPGALPADVDPATVAIQTIATALPAIILPAL